MGRKWRFLILGNIQGTRRMKLGVYLLYRELIRRLHPYFPLASEWKYLCSGITILAVRNYIICPTSVIPSLRIKHGLFHKALRCLRAACPILRNALAALCKRWTEPRLLDRAFDPR